MSMKVAVESLLALILFAFVQGCQREELTVEAGGNDALQVVDVYLLEYRIDMPNRLRAGPSIFMVENRGRHVHNFEIEGNGIERKFQSNLNSNDRRELMVDLKPGKYEVYCPVADHGSRGMRLELVVE